MTIQAEKGSHLLTMGNILVKLWQYSKPEDTGIADLKF